MSRAYHRAERGVTNSQGAGSLYFIAGFGFTFHTLAIHLQSDKKRVFSTVFYRSCVNAVKTEMGFS